MASPETASPQESYLRLLAISGCKTAYLMAKGELDRITAGAHFVFQAHRLEKNLPEIDRKTLADIYEKTPLEGLNPYQSRWAHRIVCASAVVVPVSNEADQTLAAEVEFDVAKLREAGFVDLVKRRFTG